MWKLFKRRKNSNQTDPRNLELYYDISISNHPDRFEEIKIADLHLPTGKIIASDPFFTGDIQPFSRTVDPGTYPVVLYVDREEIRVAFARVKFKPEQASTWILAVTDDMKVEDLTSLTDGEYLGFPVDAGLGCFLDAETNEQYCAAIDRFYKQSPDANYYDDLLAAEFETYSGSHPYSRSLGDWNDHYPSTSKQHNVVMFASGYGDGYYPTYWGLNSEKQTVELTIDFMLDFEEG